MDLSLYQSDIEASVRFTLQEDIGSGDITAQLIPAEQQAHARIITRDRAIIAGKAWVNEVFRQVDPAVEVNWLVEEGEWIDRKSVV